MHSKLSPQNWFFVNNYARSVHTIMGNTITASCIELRLSLLSLGRGISVIGGKSIGSKCGYLEMNTVAKVRRADSTQLQLMDKNMHIMTLWIIITSGLLFYLFVYF